MKLQELSEKATGRLKEEIENDIKYASYGFSGEKGIAYELRNSGIDMYVLHDICIGEGDPAQIDYLVITRKHCYVLECKNLYGNIKIEKDVFSRELDHGKKESIYSPVTQNQRHLEKLKEVRVSSRTNFITKKLLESNFNNIYQSVVVLANPKTVLNDRYAYKEIKEQVIRCDQLVKYLKDHEAVSKNAEMSQKEMEELANFFLSNNREDRSDYTQKYEERLKSLQEGMVEDSAAKPEPEQKSEKNKAELVKELKKFRMDASKRENIPPYYIFNDATLEQLVSKKPVSREELLKISGFGEKKAEKYGDTVIAILKKYCLIR